MGRFFTEAEERDSLVLISYRMWMQRYAGDRAVIGKAITLDGKPFRICGVMPGNFACWGIRMFGPRWRWMRIRRGESRTSFG